MTWEEFCALLQLPVTVASTLERSERNEDTMSLLRKWGLIDASSVELHIGYAPVREPHHEVNPARVSELHSYIR
jgi:hypothetical protein